MLKKLILQIPVLADAARHSKYLLQTAYEAWGVDPQKSMDETHLRREFNFDTPTEEQRYSRVLAMIGTHLGTDRWGDALEVGCSEGIFTTQLAGRCRSLVACDISPVARARAAERCSRYSHVCIEPLNVLRDRFPADYDLIFAMDVLEYVYRRRRMRQVVKKIAAALRAGGLFVFSGSSYPQESRFSCSKGLFLRDGNHLLDFMSSGFGLRLVYKEKYPPIAVPGYLNHVIGLYEKKTRETVFDPGNG